MNKIKLSISMALTAATLTLTLTLTAATPALAQSPPYVLTAPFGYGRNATGGGTGGTVTVVTTRDQFRSALLASGSAIILVSGTLTFGEGQQITGVVTDKTVIGLSGARLVSDAQVANGGIWQLNDNSNNVIIRNLVFEGPGAYDVDGRDLLFVRGTNVWVDHCEFYDGVDGNFDISNRGDNITVTWCKFGYNKPARAGGSGGSNDHRFSNLISGSDGTAPVDGRYNVTLAYNWWGNGVKERMPRARNSELHLLNNYVSTDVSGSRAIGLSAGNNGTDVYVENCHFERVGTVLDAGYGGLPRVTITGSDRGNGNTNGGTSAPAYPYTAIPWESVKAAVTGPCGAGANLEVDESTGAVSCDVTASIIVDMATASKVAPPSGKMSIVNAGHGALRINYTLRDNGNVRLDLFDAKGSRVRTLVSTAKSSGVYSERISINGLAAGMYFIKLSAGQQVLRERVLITK